MVGRHERTGRSRRGAAALLAVVVVVAIATTTLHHDPVGGPATSEPSDSVASTTPSSTSMPVRTVTISAVGDTELGNTPSLPANPTAYLAPVVPALSAPVVFGNLEGTMTDATTSKCAAASTECYAFRVPTSYAAVYRAAGFTVLNSANNHSSDFGPLGVSDTSAALAAAGIAQAGLPGQIGLVHAGGVSVAFVDFAPYTNTNDLLNLPSATALIARAHREADVVVVYMHAGAEGPSADHVTRRTEWYAGENRGNPYAFAHAAIDDGADLVIASGPHVLRGMEWYRGRLIDYSLGDFANYEDFSAAGDLDLSVILRVTLTETGSFVAARVTSLRLTSRGQTFVDPTHAAATFVNGLSREDFGAGAALISPTGAVLGAG